ncbi:OPT family oligopeptide transporter [Thermogemmata fonticola]|uniref:Oligopeptide transporter, OPT family n=1 Tax=Thermogemmata fonticola TaxID=2755323 RepID=A0A7V8VGC6_9BACT|nr:oligopeptide transporter, OPT family [Thermogemmata fonticola]MBA2227540.1 oligopeptide transporter, OPT family [Thermogemmata fonticola]
MERRRDTDPGQREGQAAGQGEGNGIPFVPPEQSPPEFTFPAVLVGVVLGILFGASSLYLVLKVGLTVSASVPIAVLSVTLFRACSRALGWRRATILENNIVQTTGSAGESIAFGVGVTMPALLLLGFEMDPIRVMTVAVLGAVLGILMMIPLRRAFIVQQHGRLPYPEGTACAEVLIAGEKGGATARMVFVGFGLAFVYKFFQAAGKLWASEPAVELSHRQADGSRSGLKGAEAAGELAPELLGVGFLIGPRIACLMMAGAILSYWVLGPLIVTFGEKLTEPVSPAVWAAEQPQDSRNAGLIRNMSPGQIGRTYLRYIGAGAVAAGGIIAMLRALPLIVASIQGGLRDLRASRAANSPARRRTEQDLPLSAVLFGSVALVLALAAIPQLGLGLNAEGLLGGVLILLFGFLFVTVSSRLTGEVGSSSNPISGMTIATLLLVCLIFVVVGRSGPSAMLSALTIAAVVCIASSNGGTTSQDLKTGFLVGATPYKQQWGILLGAISSALVIGFTMLLLNTAGTHYSKQNLPERRLAIPADAPRQRPGKPYQDDTQEYFVVHVRRGEYPAEPSQGLAEVRPGRYLVDESGKAHYRTDTPIAQESRRMDDGSSAPAAFTAPQPHLFANIIQGILGGTLEWGLVLIGALIAVSVELMGVTALPLAVGMYIPLASTVPIFLGGLLRYLADWRRGGPEREAAAETSPGVLLASGYIAGGTLCGLIVAFFAFSDELVAAVNLGAHFFGTLDASGKRVWDPNEVPWARALGVALFAILAAYLLAVGRRPTSPPAADSASRP